MDRDKPLSYFQDRSKIGKIVEKYICEKGDKPKANMFKTWDYPSYNEWLRIFPATIYTFTYNSSDPGNSRASAELTPHITDLDIYVR